jgi:hypothetical protein
MADARLRSRVIPRGGLWWAKWHWDRFILEYFGFLLSVSFHGGQLLGKEQKIIIIIFIVIITGLHKNH